jgi:hypothetical protein
VEGKLLGTGIRQLQEVAVSRDVLDCCREHVHRAHLAVGGCLEWNVHVQNVLLLMPVADSASHRTLRTLLHLEFEDG